jgi:hypothetical protein
VVLELLSILPDSAVSAGSNIALLAITPNLEATAGGQLTRAWTAPGKYDEGAFGIIRIETFGGIDDLPRHDIDIER